MQLTVERAVPLTASLLVHVALLIALLFMNLPQPEPEPEPLPIMVFMEPEQAAPAPAPAAMPAPVLPEPAATSSDPADEAEAAVTPPPEIEPAEEPVEPEPSAPPEPEAGSAEKATYADADMLEQMRRELEQSKAEQSKQERELLDKIEKLTVMRARGAKASYSSQGTAQGTVRELNIDRYPDHVQRLFMSRYGIKVQIKYVDGKGPSYINRATTERGTYYNRGGSGYFEVMSLTPAVINKMASLELEEQKKRGLDSMRTHVKSVEFGLKEFAGGRVDLIITGFETEPLD